MMYDPFAHSHRSQLTGITWLIFVFERPAQTTKGTTCDLQQARARVRASAPMPASGIKTLPMPVFHVATIISYAGRRSVSPLLLEVETLVVRSVWCSEGRDLIL
jgi:hypothetical protein